MTGIRRSLPIVLTAGAGLVSYQYIYLPRHKEPLQIYDGVTVHRPWQVRLYMRLPLNMASRLWGKVNNIYLPTWARQPVCSLYVRLFHCNMTEAAVNDLRRYQNIGELFRRQLSPESRPLDQRCPLTCPSDGTVLTCGNVSSCSVEQVKGVTYSLSRFLGPADWPQDNDRHVGVWNSQTDDDTDYLERITGRRKDTRLYQAVIYLAPGDYHRFHSPTEWSVNFRRYFPGLLLSVNPLFARHIPGLLCLNERVVYIGEWRHGFISLTAVGATNVGSVRVYHDPSLHTNEARPSESQLDRVYRAADHSQPVEFTRGELFGEFNLGSTVVLLFEAPKNFQFSISPGQKVKYGQMLGHLC